METVPAKSIITKTKSGAWFGAEFNMNVYRGCCHGCIYCDSRSDCYRIENFDTVRAKENALKLIAKQLKSIKSRGVIATGAMSDPYNPFEAQEQLTRGALKLLCGTGFGVAIATKSDLVTRDIDFLKEINKRAPVIVKITITAASDELCAKLEPHAPLSSQRFEALKALSDAGIFCGVLLMPVLPFIEDSTENITGIINKAHESGAKFVYPAFGVTLRQNQREFFLEKADSLFPGVKSKYLKAFGSSYSCVSPNASKLWFGAKKLFNEYGLLYKMADITAAYKKGYGQPAQMSFLSLLSKNEGE